MPLKKKHNATPTSCQIRQGDCLELLPDLPPARLIFADPPYNLGIDYGEGIQADKLAHEKYLAWCARWMHACADGLSDDG